MVVALTCDGVQAMRVAILLRALGYSLKYRYR